MRHNFIAAATLWMYVCCMQVCRSKASPFFLFLSFLAKHLIIISLNQMLSRSSIFVFLLPLYLRGAKVCETSVSLHHNIIIYTTVFMVVLDLLLPIWKSSCIFAVLKDKLCDYILAVTVTSMFILRLAEL